MSSGSFFTGPSATRPASSQSTFPVPITTCKRIYVSHTINVTSISFYLQSVGGNIQGRYIPVIYKDDGAVVFKGTEVFIIGNDADVTLDVTATLTVGWYRIGTYSSSGHVGSPPYQFISYDSADTATTSVNKTINGVSFTSNPGLYSSTSNAFPTTLTSTDYHTTTTEYMINFTYNTAPNAPTITSPTANQYISSRTPTITWTFSDPDSGDAQSAFDIQIVNDAYNAVLWDSGWISSSATSYTIPSGVITADSGYYVRMQVKDSAGVVNIANGSGPDANFGNQHFYSDITAPTATSVTGTQYLNVAAGGTYRIYAYGLSDTIGVTNVRFPVWTQANGQDDLIWYDGVNDGGGQWHRDIPLADHGNLEGVYQCDLYAYDAAGNNRFIGSNLTYIDRTAPSAPTQTNGILYAVSNGVSWSAFADGSTSSGLLSTTIYLQSYNGTVWSNVAGFPKSVSGVSYSFTGLAPATQYRWGIVYTDNAANANTLTYTTFTTNTYAVSTSVNLASSGYMLNQKPKFRFTVVDANDATLTNFQIQVSTINTFASTLLDTTSGASATGWGATSLTSGGTNSYTAQANIGTGTLYVRMRAYDGKDWGTWSTVVTFAIQAVSWATTISGGDTTISKRTIDEIRTKVNAVRQARGLAAAAWTDPVITDWNGATPTQIRATHLIELRQAIVDIYSALSTTSPTWTDSIIDTTINKKGVHWAELRNALISA